VNATHGLPADLIKWSEPLISFVRELHGEYVADRQAGQPPIGFTVTFGGDYNVHVAPSAEGYSIKFDVAVIATTYYVMSALVAAGSRLFRAREVMEGIPRKLPDVGQLVSSAAMLTPVQAITGNSARVPPSSTENITLTTALTCLALQFIYAHEFFHVGLGHVRYLARRSSRRAYVFAEMHGSTTAELRPIRTAFEVQADAMAGCLLFAEALASSENAIRGAKISEHWRARSFAIASVIATMHALLRASGSAPELDTMLQADKFVHPAPMKRRFYMEPFICVISEDERVQRVIKDSFNKGIADEAKAWEAAGLLAHSEPKAFLDQFMSMIRTRRSEIMRDPMHWIDEVNATLDSVADELREGP